MAVVAIGEDLGVEVAGVGLIDVGDDLVAGGGTVKRLACAVNLPVSLLP